MTLVLSTVKFESRHVQLMDLREHEYYSFGLISDIEKRLKELETSGKGMGFTLIYRDKILGSYGYFDILPGVCEVWVIPSKWIKKHGLVFARKIKKALKDLDKHLKFRRVQATSLADNYHERFFEFLGFTCEGTLRKYEADGRDAFMWARVN